MASNVWVVQSNTNNTSFVLIPNSNRNLIRAFKTKSTKSLSFSSAKFYSLKYTKSQTQLFALTESDSPKSAEPEDPQTLLRQLAESLNLPQDYFSQLPGDLRLDLNDAAFDLSNGPIVDEESLNLPQDYFAQLPGDLRLDLNDAAFDLSNGPIVDECGQELGETLLNLSRAWELADTSTSYTLITKLPSLEPSLTNNAKSALGKRLVSAGRRFQGMGQYGQGELQKIAEAMITTGRCLSASSISPTSDEQPKPETRMFKFGELQVQLTSGKANVGAAIGFVFGILSWKIAQGIQSIPESSLEYANDNALLLAKSLRGALLVVSYGSTALSAFTTVGLVLLARELKSKEE